MKLEMCDASRRTDAVNETSKTSSAFVQLDIFDFGQNIFYILKRAWADGYSFKYLFYRIIRRRQVRIVTIEVIKFFQTNFVTKYFFISWQRTEKTRASGRNPVIYWNLNRYYFRNFSSIFYQSSLGCPRTRFLFKVKARKILVKSKTSSFCIWLRSHQRTFFWWSKF